MKLLLANDDSIIHLIVKMWLNRNGHDVTSASNGQEALDLISKEYFDGMISDADMPLMTGIELIKKVLQLPDQPEMIVLLTRRCDVKEMKDVKEMADSLKEDINSSKVHLFNKPFSPSALADFIETLCKDVCGRRLLSDLTPTDDLVPPEIGRGDQGTGPGDGPDHDRPDDRGHYFI